MKYDDDQFEFEDKTPKNTAKAPNVAIVGRPNVGKSALFNALLNYRISIVHEAAGVTRDRITVPVIRNGHFFYLTDTGGLAMFKDTTKDVGIWDNAIREQAEAAIESAEVILMVVDVQKGVMPLDKEVALRLHESGKKIILVATKADNEKLLNEALTEEYDALGFGKAVAVSSLHRMGITDLMEDIFDALKAELAVMPETEAFKIAVVGRPNVGKSSIVNRLLGQKRVMVSDIAGTTRDAIHTEFQLSFRGEMRPAILVDTAGLRRKAKVDDIIEHFSNLRVEAAIKRADLVLFVTEASELGASAQDRRIGRVIAESGKACLIVVNKWDQCKGLKMKDVQDEMRATIPHLAYAPMAFVCALSGYQFEQMMDQIAIVMESLEMTVGTGLLNRSIEEITTRTPPPVVDKSALRIYYSTMVSNRPPTFTLFVNRPEACADNYSAFLARSLRERFGFIGVPVKLELKARPKKVESIRTVKPRARAAQLVEKAERRAKKTVNSRYKPSKKRAKGK